MRYHAIEMTHIIIVIIIIINETVLGGCVFDAVGQKAVSQRASWWFVAGIFLSE